MTFSDSVRNLGVMLDSKLSMEHHISKVCQRAFCELRNIAAVRNMLSSQATQTLVTSLVLSHLDYCNSLLSGIPQYLLDKLQRVQNSAARLIFRCSRRTSASPLLAKLHWLPIYSRIEYKVATICYNIINGSAPAYFDDMLDIYVPSRNNRSADDDKILRIPKMKKKTRGERAFCFYGPSVWNKLPTSVRHSPSLPQFKRNLKTYLFRQAYADIL